MDTPTFTAFVGQQRLVTGSLESVVTRVHEGHPEGPLLVFNDQTGAQLDFDLRGTVAEALARLAHDPRFVGMIAAAPAARSGPGRPRLGVVCREISLLPRHWEWLDGQPGGASASLRKLVEAARKQGDGDGRRLRDAIGKFMWTMAGNLPDFEAATRALFAGETARLRELIADWPADIRDHVESLLSRGSAADG